MRRRRIWVLVLTEAIGLLALAAPARADDWWADTLAPTPSLTDVAAANQAPALFTVTGEGFTSGGRVDGAVYDQMGAKRYETRRVTASTAATVKLHAMGEGSLRPAR